MDEIGILQHYIHYTHCLTVQHLTFYLQHAFIIMDLIHYLFAPLILFSVPYTLNLLPYYLSIANGAGSVGIFELTFQSFV